MSRKYIIHRDKLLSEMVLRYSKIRWLSADYRDIYPLRGNLNISTLGY